jgi:hypothetical protein
MAVQRKLVRTEHLHLGLDHGRVKVHRAIEGPNRLLVVLVGWGNKL